MGRFNRQSAGMNRAMGNMRKSSMSLGLSLRGVGAALAALGLAKVVGGTISTINSFEQLNAQLRTITGSAEEASIAFAQIADFTKTTPFQLDEVTGAFITLKRMGIDTSTASLRAFGNIAAANGKSFTQLSEAVADAMTGEFERLKEFGIKVRQENNQFVASMGDTEVAVAGSASSLVQQLRKLGEEGGAYAEGIANQAATLGGMFSNLQDNMSMFAAGVGRGGLATALKEVVGELNTVFGQSEDFALQVGAALGATIRFLTRSIKQILDVFVPVFKIIFKTLRYYLDLVAGVFTEAYNFIADTLTGILDYFGYTWTDIQNTVSNAINNMIGIFHLFGIAVYNTVTNFPKIFTEVFRGIGETVIEFGSALITKFGDIGEAMYLAIIAPFTDATFEQALQKLIGNPFDNLNFADNFEDVPEILSKEDIDKAFQTDYIEKVMNTLRITIGADKEIEDLKKALLSLENPFEALGRFTEDYNELLAAGKSEQDAFNKALEIAKEREAALGGVIPTTTTAVEQQAAALGLGVDELEKFNEALKDFRGSVTALEDLEGGISAFNRLNPLEGMKQTYDKELRGLELLRNRDKINEEEYLKSKADLHAEYVKNVGDMNRQLMEEQIRQSGITNQAILSSLQGSLRNFEQIQQGGLQAAMGMTSELGNIFTQLGTYNKQAFQAAKAFNIANAIMNTYLGATKALAMFPPPFNFIAAAGVVAAGLAQVSAIRSQSYSGRSLGGPVMGGDSYIVGENGPELFTPSQTGSITRNQDLTGAPPVEVTFNINAIDAQGFDELLVSRKSVIQQVISDAYTEQGTRSRF